MKSIYMAAPATGDDAPQRPKKQAPTTTQPVPPKK